MAAEVSLKRHVEELNIHPAHVVPHPLLEDIDEEAAVLFAPYRAFRDQVARLPVERALTAGLLAPAEVRDLDRLCRSALDNGDELYPLSTQFIAKKAIHGAAPVFRWQS